MSVLEKLQRISAELFNSELKAQKQNNRKIIGIFCSYVPEELIVAAGMIPFRMRAATANGTTLGDTWFSSFNCSYVRHLMTLTLEEKFSFLDGVIFINACDHIRRMYDNWRMAAKNPSFIHMVGVPRKKSGISVKRFRDELEILKQAMETHFDIHISDKALNDAIRVSNEIRKKLNTIYDMRKEEVPPITAAEMLSVIMAGTAIPREQFLDMLDALIKEISGRTVYKKNVPRLMLQSGCMEEIEHIRLIESLGSAIVDDSICLGRRYFDTYTRETAEDPLEAIAERYMNHLSCPRISDDWQRRLAYLESSVKNYRLDGLLLERLKFCDLWGGEAFIMQKDSKRTGLPTLYLEREYNGGGEGQIKTRIQAFLERIGKI